MPWHTCMIGGTLLASGIFVDIPTGVVYCHWHTIRNLAYLMAYFVATGVDVGIVF